MTLAPEELDPNSDLRRKARANVASFPPLTGEQLAEISRLFAGTNVPSAAAGGPRAGGSGGARTVGGDPPPPMRAPSAPRSSASRRAHSGARRDASLPKS